MLKHKGHIKLVLRVILEHPSVLCDMLVNKYPCVATRLLPSHFMTKSLQLVGQGILSLPSILFQLAQIISQEHCNILEIETQGKG